MDLEDLPYLLIVLGIATVGFFAFVNELKVSSVSNSTMDNSEFNLTFNKIDEEMQRINQSESSLFGSGINSQFSFLPTVQSFLGVAGILKGTIQSLRQMIEVFTQYLPIATILKTALIGVISIAFIWAIYRATLGRLKI